MSHSRAQSAPSSVQSPEWRSLGGRQGYRSREIEHSAMTVEQAKSQLEQLGITPGSTFYKEVIEAVERVQLRIQQQQGETSGG